MCQGYDAEYSLICSLERNAIIRGFVAARLGLSQDDSKETYKWDFNYGWSCWHERKFPFSIKDEYIAKNGYYAFLKAQKEFKENQGLPSELEITLDVYSRDL